MDTEVIIRLLCRFSLEGSCYKIIPSWLNLSLVHMDVLINKLKLNSYFSIYLEKRNDILFQVFISLKSVVGKVNVAHKA